MTVDKDLIALAVGPDRYERGRQIAWPSAARAGRALGRTDAERADDTALFDIVGDVLAAAFHADDTAASRCKVCSLATQRFSNVWPIHRRQHR